MYCSYQFDEISEFERVSLKERFLEELSQIQEIQMILEEAFHELNSKKIHLQRSRAIKLEHALRGKIKQIELESRLKMLTLNLSDMKKVYKALKKRRISRIDPRALQDHLALLEEKMKDEIYREECGVKQGFKSFPVSEIEVDILLETIAI